MTKGDYNMQIKPLFDKVVLKKVEAVESTKAGILLPGSAQEKPQVDYIDIVCWRNNAEFVTKYFRKGSAAFVSGSLQVRTWQDKDGKNRRTYEVVADEVQFAESKKDSSARFDEAPSFTAGTPGDFEEMTGDDELPF